ncbi:hypothetical protein KSP39_PZI008755 [Platanthera zijinensis]|uniref:Uncharacterized protein n=1 Tax=Platanthera zijinensis TaxID=2320716 RepID=A0AAP0BLD1_9ASPA
MVLNQKTRGLRKESNLDNRGKEGTVPYRDNGSSTRWAYHTSSVPCVFLVAGTEQQGKTRPPRPGLEGEPYESESIFLCPSRSFSYRGKGKESKEMDINEPSLMDVAHDTINLTRRSGASLLSV